jgi:hypothetical protein
MLIYWTSYQLRQLGADGGDTKKGIGVNFGIPPHPSVLTGRPESTSPPSVLAVNNPLPVYIVLYNILYNKWLVYLLLSITNDTA